MTYLSQEDIQNLLHLNARQARAFLKTEGVPSVQIGAQFLIEESLLQNYLAENKTTRLVYNKQ